MLSTINTEVGSAEANSYISVEEADAYFEARFFSGEGWSGLTTDQKTSRLLQATLVLDRLQFIGEPASLTQSLAWPRRSIHEIGYFSHLLSALGKPIAPDEVPAAIKYAQTELALIIFDEEGTIFESSATPVKSETLGKFSISYVKTWPLLACPAAMDYLYPFLVNSTRTERA